MKKLIALVALFMFVAVMSYATETTTGTGTAKAKIVAAATIEEVSGSALNFGTIFKKAGGGTVSMTAAESTSRTSSTLTFATGGYSSDHFLMSNLDVGTTYNLSVPASVSITRDGGSETMTVAPVLSVTSFEADAATKDIFVGGTLTVGDNQAVGQYSGTYLVTVTY